MDNVGISSVIHIHAIREKYFALSNGNYCDTLEQSNTESAVLLLRVKSSADHRISRLFPDSIERERSERIHISLLRLTSVVCIDVKYIALNVWAEWNSMGKDLSLRESQLFLLRRIVRFVGHDVSDVVPWMAVESLLQTTLI